MSMRGQDSDQHSEIPGQKGESSKDGAGLKCSVAGQSRDAEDWAVLLQVEEEEEEEEEEERGQPHAVKAFCKSLKKA